MNAPVARPRLTDFQWSQVEKLLSDAKPGGRSRTTDTRAVFDAILHILSTGSPVHRLPPEFPPWQTVYTFLRRWQNNGVLKQVRTAFDENDDALASLLASPRLIRRTSQKTSKKGGRNRAWRRAQTRVHYTPEDYYPSPPEAIFPFLEVEKFDGLIWEPACGDGALSRALEARGYAVISTDLVDRGYGVGGHDFFSSPHTAANIVTNPPYRHMLQFVEHALSRTTDKVAMLLPMAFLTSKRRRPFLERNPPTRVWVFSERVSMWPAGKRPEKRRGTGFVDYAWMVWQHGHNGPPAVHWLTQESSTAV
jgi:transposase